MTSSTVAFAEVGHVDSLTAYSTGGELIGVQANVFSDPVFHSINTTAGSVEQLCAVELPESFRPDRPDLIGFNNGGLAYDSRRNVLWHVGLNEPLARVVIGNDCSATIPQAEQTFGADAIAYVPGFSINPGLNDAWYNPDTDGQGFYIVVFGDTKTVSLAWFTYDTEQPTDNAKAVVGDPGHRWLTAFGAFDDTTATLDVVNTIGGSFDDGLPAPSSEPFGTIDLSFDNCESGRIEYEFPGPDLRGSMPIQRVADTNVALCEKLSKAPSIESIH